MRRRSATIPENSRCCRRPEPRPYNRRMVRRLLVALLVLLSSLAAGPVAAQPPDDEWRTLELPHFRVHYPAASEAWALHAAARLEAVRERLREEVGYAPPRAVDVVVADPLSRPNGSAWPFLANPRMVLWTTPPEPASTLGLYRDWGELVALHEDAHLVHLLRPSRNPWRRRLGRLVPGGGLGPIALRAPRWVSEGYATLLEGRLTGAGRPNGDLRAALLRQRARAGRLPGYGALGAGDESWLGPSMAYLAGSAYLEWLEERAGGDALAHLWARMTARHDRGFDEAFEGVFGAGPAELYGRFTAELTWRALEAERRLGSGEDGDPDALWLDRSWGTGAPVVSPDGSRLAVTLPERDDPPSLVVWETAVDEEAEREQREERERIAAADPEDVPAVRTAPPLRKQVAELPTFDGRAPLEPRWLPDGESLLFSALGPGTDGVLHDDLYLWDVDGGRVTRLTRGADVRQADPLPAVSGGDGDGDGAAAWAVAVRSRHGFSQLVAVDLDSGEVRPLTEASVEEVWASPRVSPEGDRLAAVRHRDEGWRLVVAEVRRGADGAPELGEPRTLENSKPQALEAPTGATVAWPAWAPDGRTLYAAVGGGGFVDLWAFDLAGGAPPRRLTETLGAALAPEPTPDGAALFFLALEHDGLDVRRLDLREESGAALAAGVRAPLPATLAPAVPPAPPAGAPPFAPAELPPARPYGAGPQDVTPLVGLALAPSGLAVEGGVRGGDVVGRLDWLLLGSLGGDGAMEGGAFAAAWRGWPVAVSGHLFAVSEAPSEQRDAPAGAGAALDRDVTGVELATSWDRTSPAGALALRLGGHWAGIDLATRERQGKGAFDTAAATLAVDASWAPASGRRALPLDIGLRLQEGSTDGEAWRRWSVRGGAGLELGDSALRLEYARHGSADLPFVFEQYQLGGVRRSLLPDAVDATRIPVPALPAAWLVGDGHESQRVELRLGFLPAPLFYERHRVWRDGEAKGDWLSLAGLELRGTVPPLPVVGLPALGYTAGAAYVLDDPAGDLEDEIRAWAAVAWRP